MTSFQQMRRISWIIRRRFEANLSILKLS